MDQILWKCCLFDIKELRQFVDFTKQKEKGNMKQTL